MTLVDFHQVELPPPPLTQHVHIQTDGDYTKRVVTPFGTTRLKIKSQDVLSAFLRTSVPSSHVACTSCEGLGIAFKKHQS